MEGQGQPTLTFLFFFFELGNWGMKTTIINFFQLIDKYLILKAISMKLKGKQKGSEKGKWEVKLWQKWTFPFPFNLTLNIELMRDAQWQLRLVPRV